MVKAGCLSRRYSPCGPGSVAQELLISACHLQGEEGSVVSCDQMGSFQPIPALTIPTPPPSRCLGSFLGDLP